MPERVSRSLPDAHTARAMPKSSSTAPCGEMTTFSGLTSRWMMPCPCACSSASSRSSATRSVSATESRAALGQELAQGGALRRRS